MALVDGGGMSESNAPSGLGGPGAAATDDLLVADYRLGRRVGTDVYGEIYVGNQSDSSAVVTLLHDRIVIDVIAARRFAEETALVSDLVTWGVIPTLDFDFQTRPRWIASASASGQLLRQRVDAGGPLQPSSVRLLASQLARALQALHARGVTQRDLSPDSVLLGAESAALWHSGWSGLLDGSDYAGTSHTEHVEWLAPEQFTGDPIGPSSDIHAWAVTILYAATGYNPFAAEKASVSVGRLMRETPIIPAVFDPVLASLVAGGLAKDPAVRPSARDLVTFLDSSAPLLEPSSPTPIGDVAAHHLDAQPDVENGEVAGSAVDLEKRSQQAPVVNLTKAAATHPQQVLEDGFEFEAEGSWDEAGREGADPASWNDEDDVEYNVDSSGSGGRRIGLAPLVGLGLLVVVAGSAVGVVIGRVFGG